MIHPSFVVFSVFLSLFSFSFLPLCFSFPPISQSAAETLLTEVDHIVILYFENQSFDFLLSSLPSVDGAVNLIQKTQTNPQKDQNGNVFPSLPIPNGVSPSSPLATRNFPSNLPINGDNLYNISIVTPFDITHRFYIEKMQINKGKMDQYAVLSSGKGYTMTSYDLSTQPESLSLWDEIIANDTILCDHFHHSAFGGSFLNHQYLIAAAAPIWDTKQYNYPMEIVTQTDQSDNAIITDYNNPIDNILTTNGFAVNTIFANNYPLPYPYDTNQPMNYTFPLLPLSSTPTIGDSLTSHNVSWTWFSEGWNNALSNPNSAASASFEYHHQPFLYFERFAATKDNYATQPERALHLKDEVDFLSALRNDNSSNVLPSVSWVKPSGDNDFHPNQNDIMDGVVKLKQYLAAIKASPLYSKMLVIITFDENGGLFDHVVPPGGDYWGPGVRVPSLLISPLFTQLGILSSQNGLLTQNLRGQNVITGFSSATMETLSIVKLIERKFGLVPMDGVNEGKGSIISYARWPSVNDLTLLFDTDMSNNVIHKYDMNNNINLQAYRAALPLTSSTPTTTQFNISGGFPTSIIVCTILVAAAFFATMFVGRIVMARKKREGERLVDDKENQEEEIEIGKKQNQK